MCELPVSRATCFGYSCNVAQPTTQPATPTCLRLQNTRHPDNQRALTLSQLLQQTFLIVLLSDKSSRLCRLTKASSSISTMGSDPDLDEECDASSIVASEIGKSLDFKHPPPRSAQLVLLFCPSVALRSFLFRKFRYIVCAKFVF